MSPPSQITHDALNAPLPILRAMYELQMKKTDSFFLEVQKRSAFHIWKRLSSLTFCFLNPILLQKRQQRGHVDAVKRRPVKSVSKFTSDAEWARLGSVAEAVKRDATGKNARVYFFQSDRKSNV